MYKMTKEEVRENYLKHLEYKKKYKKSDIDSYCRNKSLVLNKATGRW